MPAPKNPHGPVVPPPPPNSFGAVILKARKARGWSQAEALSEMRKDGIDMSSTTISDIENNKRYVLPELKNRLCRFYGVAMPEGEVLPNPDPISKKEATRIARNILLSFMKSAVDVALVTTSSVYDENLVESGYDPNDERIMPLVSQAADDFVSLLYEEYYKEKKR